MARATGLTPRKREPPPRPKKRKVRRKRRSTTGYVAGSPKGGKKGTVRKVGSKPPVTDTPKRAARRRARRQVDAPPKSKITARARRKRAALAVPKVSSYGERAKLQRKGAESFRELSGPPKRSKPKRYTPPKPSASPTRSKSDDVDELATAIEAQVIEPAKRADVLPEDKTTGQKIYGKVAEYGPLALTLGPELLALKAGLRATLGGTAAGGARVGGVKGIKRAVKPAKATAPAGRAEVAHEASRQAGRAVAKARGTGGAKAAAKRALGKVTRSEGKQGRRVAQRAAGTPGRRAFAAEAGLPLKGTKAAASQNLAVVRGHEQALLEEPGQTLKTTARIAPGVITTPIGMVANVGISTARLASAAAHEMGIPGFRPYSGEEILDPVKGEAKAQAEFLRQVGSVALSDDPEYVKEQVQEHLGLLLPAVAAPILARGFKPAYQRTLENVRRDAEQRRAASGRQRRPPGEEAQHLRPDAERRALRKEESKASATAKHQVEIENAARAKDVLGHARKAKGPVVTVRTLPKPRAEKGKRGSATRKVQVHPGDATGLLARQGINRDPVYAIPQIKRIHDQLDPEQAASLPRHKLNTLDVTAYLLEHPQVLADEDLWKAVDAYKAQAEDLTTSEAARVQPVMQAHADPELGQRNPGVREFERVPLAAREHTDAATRTELVKEIASDRAKLKRAAVKGADPERVRAIAAQITAKERGLYAKMSPEERRAIVADLAEEGITEPTEVQAAVKEARAQKAIDSDEALRREYLDQAAELIREQGYEEPAFVSQADVRAKGSPEVSAVGGQLPHVPAGTKQRTGALQEMGAIEESLPALLRESIRVPVARKHIFARLRDFVQERAIAYQGKTEFTSREAGLLFDTNVLDPRHNILVPRQLYKRAFDDLKRGNEEGMAALREAISEEAQEQLLSDLPNAAKGRKYIIVPREAANEFFAQTEKLRWDQDKIRMLNNVTSRAILGTSPAWAAMQVLAEGTQAAVAVNPYRMKRGLEAFEQLPFEKKVAFQAYAGEAPGVVLSPRDLQLALRDGDMMNAHDAFGVANKTTAGRLFFHDIPTAELLGRLDRLKGGYYRRAVAAGHIDRMLNSRMHKFAGGMRDLWRAENRITDKLKDKPLKEQLEWFVDNPKEMKRIQTYLDDVMGNWNALTRYERTASSLVIFYPFLRMSLRWLLWSFPKQHPIKASIGYYLGQQTAVELEQLLGGDPSFFKWGQVPVRTGEDGEAGGLVDLARMAPAANALIEGVGGGEGAPGTAGLRVIQPWLSAAIAGMTGVDPLSGRQEDQAGFLALAQIASLPLPFRLAGLPELLPGQGPSDSPTGRAFRKEGSEGVTSTLRKSVLPVIPKPLDQEKRKTRLSELTDKKYENPIPSVFTAEVVKALFGNPDGTVNKQLARRIAKQRERGQAAGEKATALQQEILGEALGDLTDEQSEWLQLMTGGVFIPLDPAEEAKLERAGKGATIGGRRIGGGSVKARRGDTRNATGQTRIGGVVISGPEPKRKVRPKGTKTSIGGVPVG